MTVISTIRRPNVTTRFMLLGLLASTIVVPAAAQQPARTNAPQPIPRAGFLAQADSAFVAVDANKDGFTDRAEIEAAETRAFATAKARGLREREAAFRRLDADKNGALTLTEFNSVAVAQQLPKADATKFLNALDTNKDGKISLAENRAPNAVRFDRADTNKDGSLSVAEQRAVSQRRQ